jgi:glycosyltransferase involved in cell wall biosynthesis
VTDLAPASSSDTRALRVLFVCGSDLGTPSEKQALWAARELARRGHSPILSLRRARPGAHEPDVPEGVSVLRHELRGRKPSSSTIAAAVAARPDLIHAWSPRQPIMVLARAYCQAIGTPLAVHWEDDEWLLMHGVPGAGRLRRIVHATRRAISALARSAWHFSTPWSLAWATEHAAAFDALTPALAAEVERRTGRSCAVILPASPPEAWDPGPADVAGPQLAPDGSHALLFTGDIHFARADDLAFGLTGIAELQERGHDVRFVHAGRNSLGSDIETLARRTGMRPGSTISLGTLPFERIPPLLRRAAVLLEPGLPSPFNRLRLPSKLQAYLASGTPVVTFAVGAGELLTDRTDAVLTHGSDPSELADAIEAVLTDDELRERLRRNGPLAARRLFDPAANVDRLLAHYGEVLGAGQFS